VTQYKLDELARAAEVAPRTVRYYVQRGLVPAPEFHGKDTSYGPEHLLRLRAIKRLQEARLPLEEIAARLAAASPAELERLAAEPAFHDGAASGPKPRAGEASAPRPPAPRAALHGARWERFVLAPGLELHLADGADPRVERLARAILDQHRPPAKETEE
jgi:DNA-binding transcriptional MerR regulator